MSRYPTFSSPPHYHWQSQSEDPVSLTRHQPVLGVFRTKLGEELSCPLKGFTGTWGQRWGDCHAMHNGHSTIKCTTDTQQLKAAPPLLSGKDSGLQETRVQPLSGKHPHTGPQGSVRHIYWACALEPRAQPPPLELRSTKRSRPRWGEAHALNQRAAPTSTKT